MNWEAVGAIAEMIGFLAVLVTLAYLAFQVRQANKIAMSSSTNQARAGGNRGFASEIWTTSGIYFEGNNTKQGCHTVTMA